MRPIGFNDFFFFSLGTGFNDFDRLMGHAISPRDNARSSALVEDVA